MSAGFIEQGQYVNVTGANESNKMVAVNIAQYTAPIEVTPTTGFDGMEKVTIELGPGTPTKYWEGVSWEGFETFFGLSVWTDGDTIYVSNEHAHYYLDKNTNTWRPKHWNVDFFRGRNVWTDGTDIYLGVYYDQQYVLNKISGEWETKTYGGNGWSPNSDNVEHIWTDGTNTYYSIGHTRDDPAYNAVYNKATSTWETKTWYGMTDFSGQNVWTDGDNVYYSSGSGFQWVLNKETDTWVQKTWNGFTNIIGKFVWTDGEDIYYSYNNNQYKLDKTTDTWIPTDWTNKLQISGDCVWTDGENVYHSAILSSDTGLNTHYVFKNSLIKLQNKIVCNDNHATADAEYNGLNKVTIINNADQWVSKSWSSSSLTTFDGRYVWHDNGNTYYSQSSLQKQLTGTFTKDHGFYDKTWNGTTDFYGNEVWHDGDNTYLSNDNQYVLNRATDTWEEKTWNGMTNFSGVNIWTDGENIYYNGPAGGAVGRVSRVLNRATDTWEEKTWNISMDGVDARYQIFNCNNNIYLRKTVNNSQVFYILDKISKEWIETPTTVSGNYTIEGNKVWSVGGMTYFNNSTAGGGTNLKLRYSPLTGTWYSDTDHWKGLTDFNAEYIWYSDNTGNIYYSYSGTQYQLYTPAMKNIGRFHN